jgi:hypothetical protein
MFTTTGMVRFAMAAKEGGRPLSNAARLAPSARGDSQQPNASKRTPDVTRTAPDLEREIVIIERPFAGAQPSKFFFGN